MISDKKRKEYIDSLYSKKEQKQIKESIERKKMQLEVDIGDYLLLDEKFRILKKHFKLTHKQTSDIIDKYRIPSKSEERMLNILQKTKK